MGNRSERTHALVQGSAAWRRVKHWRCSWFISNSGLRRRRLRRQKRSNEISQRIAGAPEGVLAGVYWIYVKEGSKMVDGNNWDQLMDGDVPRNMTLDCNGHMYEYDPGHDMEQMDRHIETDTDKVRISCHDRTASNKKHSNKATFY